ncbi:MAG: hypothetical protein ACI4BA_02370 [Prevotella sp.]
MALAAMLLAPATTMADSWQKTVTNASEFKSAFSAVGAGAAGETYEIICDWDASELVAVGKLKPTQTNGRLIIRSNQTDFDKMPQLQMAFEWGTDAPTRGELGQMMSIIIENMNMVGTGSYLMDNRRAIYADTIALRHCDIHDQVRSILRLDGDKGELTGADGNKLGATDYFVDCIEVKECRLHGTAQAQGDNWSPFRTFIPFNTFNVTDCMFYDMPYAKSIWETRNPNTTPSQVNFSNNLVLLGQNKAIATSGFTPLMTGANLPAGTMIQMHNNIFAGPQKGIHILVNDTSNYNNTAITNAQGATIFAQNNVVDEGISYISMDELTAKLAGDGTSETYVPSTLLASGTISLSTVEGFSWETGATFQDASIDQYNMLNSNPWKTQGIDYVAGEGVYYIGPSIAYVDAFPVLAKVNVTVDGPSYIKATISPEKSVYYVGDEVSISFADHNSAYRTLNSFKGWSDDTSITESSRTVTLEGDLNLSAKFEPVVDGIVSLLDFSEVAGNANLEDYAADAFIDEAHKAVATMMVVDTVGLGEGLVASPFNYVKATAANKNFQARAAKFGEDDIELQMPVISRRSPAVAHHGATPQVNYAVFTLSSKDLKDIKFSCYVGSDNYMFTKQMLDYSVDGGATWTNFASYEMTEDDARDALFGLEETPGTLYGWAEVKGNLPAAAENVESLQIRVISDPASTALTNSAAGAIALDANDTFEYIGSVLITADCSAIDTGIESIQTNNSKIFNANAPIYNLMGVQVKNASANGLYIQNGKKFFKK